MISSRILTLPFGAPLQFSLLRLSSVLCCIATGSLTTSRHMAAVASIPAICTVGFQRFLSQVESPTIRPPANALRFPHDFRLVDAVGPHAKKRVLVVYASNINRPNPNAAGKGKTVTNSSNTADGPPLLTILAGVLVFLIFLWVIGSIVMWLISLIVNVPPS